MRSHPYLIYDFIKGVILLKYNIMTLADIHWDAFDIQQQADEMQLPLEFIRSFPNLDLVVIAGDYFDTKLSLNSKAAKISVSWMGALVNICKNRKIKIRIIKGTNSHDNNQLEIFKAYEKDDPDNFKIFNSLTVEETLPEMKILYAPDENMPNDTYFSTYNEELHPESPYDMMFFHGTFDIVSPNIAVQESEIEGIHNVIFQYSIFSKICRVMIGGHWHDAEDPNFNMKQGTEPIHMYYTRSLSRWAFNEEHSKGFLYACYDTETHSYYLERIENPFTDKYQTIYVDTRDMVDATAYRDLIQNIMEELKDNPTNHYRIKFMMTDEKIMNSNGLELIKRTFNSEKRVKIVVKDMLKEKKKSADKVKTQEIKDQFAFVMDPNQNPAEIIQRFISITKKKEIPLDTIHGFIDQYLNI